MPHHTPYQKGIIKRFYEHRDTLALQKLAEAVSNLYLETSEAKVKRTWNSVRTQLVNAGVSPNHVDDLVGSRDLESLAKIVAELS